MSRVLGCHISAAASVPWLFTRHPCCSQSAFSTASCRTIHFMWSVYFFRSADHFVFWLPWTADHIVPGGRTGNVHKLRRHGEGLHRWEGEKKGWADSGRPLQGGLVISWNTFRFSARQHDCGSVCAEVLSVCCLRSRVLWLRFVVGGRSMKE